MTATSRLNQNSLLFTSDGSTQISKLSAASNLFTLQGSSGDCRLTGVADPTSAQDAATRSYVDSKVNGVTWKNAVTASSTSNITRDSGSASNTIEGTGNGALPSQDGVSLEANERLLVKHQTESKFNGIYTVTRVGDGSSTYLLSRTEDNNSDSEMKGAAVFVQEGTLHADTGWVMSTDTITLNTSALTWAKFSHTGGNVAGSGITVSGREISISSSAVTNAMLAGSILADKLDGNIPDAKISALSASKLTGTLNVARVADASLLDAKISSLNSNKLTGTLAVDRLADSSVTDAKISGLSASKLTGTINNDRLSSIPASALAGSIGDSKISDVAASKLTGSFTLAVIPTITAAKMSLGEALAADGEKVAVQYDDSTIAVNAGEKLIIKDLGVSTAKLADDCVNGDKLTNDITIATTSTVTANTFTATSDVRLKENVESMNNSLDKVCSMDGKRYNFKSSPNEKRSGVIAQEIQEVCPELVKCDEKGMLSVNYIDIIPYLIESIKELKYKVYGK
jgi:hypothetical protein